MKNIIISIILSCHLFSCTEKTNDEFENILNDNFLIFTDTIAYSHQSFFVIPNDTNIKKASNNGLYYVCVDKNIKDSKKLRSYLDIELNLISNFEYKELLSKHLNQKKIFLNLNRISRTGKYKILDLDTCEMSKSIHSVGTLTFYEPIIDNNKAIVFLSKQSSPKAGVLNSFLLKKINGKWVFDKKIELERW